MFISFKELPFWYDITFVFIFGLIVGSFLNVVVCRAFTGESIVFPSSKCPKCNNKLKWFHNIPVLSYLFLRGKCGFCKEKISIQYPIVELVTAVTFAGIFFHWQFSLTTLFAFIFAALAIVISVCDIREKVVFTGHTWLLAMVGLLYGILNTTPGNRVMGGLESVLGWITGFFVCAAVAKILKRLIGTDVLGDGDADILGAIGAVVGWKLVLFVPLIGSIVASLWILPVWGYSVIKEKKYGVIFNICIFIFLACLKLHAEYNNYIESYFSSGLLTILLCIFGVISCILLLKNIEAGKNCVTIPFGPVLIAGGVLIFVFRDYVLDVLLNVLNIAKFW